mgnify:CR=1 FL=1
MLYVALEKFFKQFSDQTLSCSQFLQEANDGFLSFTFSNSAHDDYNLILDRLEKSLPSLINIVQNPYIVLKPEYEKTYAGKAGALTPKGVQMTLQDTSVWKKGENPRPEYVYSRTFEDDYDTYENRVIKALIDRLIVFLNKPIENTKSDIKNIYNEYFSKGPLNKLDFVKILNPEVFKSTKDEDFDDYKRLFYLRAKCSSLRNSAFYKIMNRCTPYSGGTPESTNLFNHNVDYRNCFMLWRFLDGQGKEQTILNVEQRKSVYSAFIFLATIKIFSGYGFALNSDFLINNIDDNFCIQDVRLGNSDFIVSLSIDIEKMTIIVKSRVTGVFQKSVIGINSDYLDEVNFENFDFVLSLFSTENSEKFACVSPANESSLSDLDSIIKCCILVVDASKDIYSRMCLVCGSSFIEETDDGFLCEDCGAYYSFLNPRRVWIRYFNTLPNKN